EDGIRDRTVTGVQTCALPIYCCSTIRSRSVRVSISRRILFLFTSHSVGTLLMPKPLSQTPALTQLIQFSLCHPINFSEQSELNPERQELHENSFTSTGKGGRRAHRLSRLIGVFLLQTRS